MKPSEHLLRTLAPLPPSWRVVEVICDEGRHTEAMVRLGFDVYAVDVEEEAVARTRQRLEGLLPPEEQRLRVQQGSLLRLPFEAEQFDWAVVFHVGKRIYTLRDFRYMMAEVFRVMKWGAWVSVGVPARREGVDRLAFTPEQLQEEMEALGFALAEAPVEEMEEDYPIWSAVYRKVNEETPA